MASSLNVAHEEWVGDRERNQLDEILSEQDREMAGDWCSLVLGVLGFEWV